MTVLKTLQNQSKGIENLYGLDFPPSWGDSTVIPGGLLQVAASPET